MLICFLNRESHPLPTKPQIRQTTSTIRNKRQRRMLLGIKHSHRTKIEQEKENTRTDEHTFGGVPSETPNLRGFSFLLGEPTNLATECTVPTIGFGPNQIKISVEIGPEGPHGHVQHGERDKSPRHDLALLRQRG